MLAGERENPVVGLATGDTPGPMYAALSRVGLPALRAFAIDEYGGPRVHPCNNRAYFERHWRLIPGAGDVEQFDPEVADRRAECERFAGALAAAGGLDLVVLGIGMNGHLGFNEPGSKPHEGARLVSLHETTRQAAARCWGDHAPRTGLTLGLSEILSARAVLLLATGERKAAVVARALEGEVGPEVPASHLQEQPRLTVVVDEAAAALLRAAR